MYHSHPLSLPSMTAAPLSHNNRPLIEVTGEGTVSATPNRAIIVLGVITQNQSLAAAQRENASTVTNVMNALLKLNIPKERIQTVTYRIEMQYSYEDGKQIFKGYQVTHLLQITIDRVEQTGLVVDTAVGSGANIVSSIQFTIANPEIYSNQALSTAIQNAQSKGDTIARTIGVTLVRTPVKITEETRVMEPPIPFQASLLAKGAAVPTPIQPGELKINAVVRAQFTYY